MNSAEFASSNSCLNQYQGFRQKVSLCISRAHSRSSTIVDDDMRKGFRKISSLSDQQGEQLFTHTLQIDCARGEVAMLCDDEAGLVGSQSPVNEQ